MELLNSYNISFVGRTGNGKSSLLNQLWGTSFSTDPLVACTKELYSVTLLETTRFGHNSITVYDTPGIGEFSTDSKYELFYRHAIGLADCVVLVSTFDRTDAPIQRFLMRMKEYLNPTKSVRFIVALNHIDSKIITDVKKTYEPWDMVKNEPTTQCRTNIEERIGILHKRLDGKFLPFTVVPVCAVKNFGITELKNNILNL